MTNLVKALFAVLLLWPPIAGSQSDPRMEELRKLAWQNGPAEARIADKATLQIPPGHVFLDASNTRRFLEITGNPPREGRHLFAPESLKWISIFSFDPSGLVKDDEKIDAEALLKSLKEGDGPGNEERKRLGMESLITDGWQVPPHYDAGTKRLEWGTRIKTERGETLVNYTSRLLGRSGVMSAVLVSDPESLAADTQEFKSALQQFSYVAGEKYDEFKPGTRSPSMASRH